LGGCPGVWLVGSHGAEHDNDSSPVTIHDDALDALRAELEVIAAGAPGALVEVKPGAAALHTRRCVATDADAAVHAATALAERFTGLRLMRGHGVVEFTLWKVDKGIALERLRKRAAARVTVFVGDDRTDEEAFKSLTGGSVGIKVGPGETAAAYRVRSQGSVTALLQRMLMARRQWLSETAPRPIERHSVLSDQRTVMLVDETARVVWGCLPRADGGAVFAELLGGPRAGFFGVEPLTSGGEPPVPSQAYLGDSMVLKTSWDRLSVTDYLDCSGGRAYQRAGRSDLIRVLEGDGAVRVTLAPRFDFGRRATTIRVVDDGLEIEAGSEAMALYAPGVQWALRHDSGNDTATAEIRLRGESVTLELRGGLAHATPPRLAENDRRNQTVRFWSGWAASLRMPSVAPAAVLRSALVLKALCYGPTGAVFAAATTSLPEQLGGERNWDYRFCWPRDACLAAAALVRLGNTGVAMKLLDWLVSVVESVDAPERLRPIYTVTGEALWPEAEIGALSGYASSRPVRIGNAADSQVQLDVFGPIVDLVTMVAEAGLPVTPEHWRLVQAMVTAVAARWREPDHGIWEIRGAKRHHVHSRVMCWLAAHRGARIAEIVTGKPRGDWVALAAEIKDDVLAHGFSPERGSFTSAYGGGALDAASLWVLLSGFLPPDDPRSVATVRAVERELLEGPAVYRYREDDGIPGVEGAFLITAFWLAECLWMIGDSSSARDLFDRASALAGPTGMLSEQFDPRRRSALGNVPQAYSHLGLINAAVRLSAG